MATKKIYKNQVVEFLNSFLGTKSMKTWLITLGVVFLSGFIPYFEKYIFFNFFCFVLFNISMVVDIFSAISLAKIRGGGFETNKAMKAVVKLIGYNYLLYLSHVINQFFMSQEISESIFNGLKVMISPDVAAFVEKIFADYSISPYAIFLYAFIVISLSAIKNFQLADSFRSIKKFDRWVYTRIDIYKNRPSDRLWKTLTQEQQEKILEKLDKRGEV